MLKTRITVPVTLSNELRMSIVSHLCSLVGKTNKMGLSIQRVLRAASIVQLKSAKDKNEKLKFHELEIMGKCFSHLSLFYTTCSVRRGTTRLPKNDVTQFLIFLTPLSARNTCQFYNFGTVFKRSLTPPLKDVTSFMSYP